MYRELDFEFKTSTSLFGSSHLQHISDGNNKKELIQHFNDFTGIKLPNNKKGIEFLNKSNCNVLDVGEYYALGIPDSLDFYIFITSFKGKGIVVLISRFTDCGYELPKCILMNCNILNDECYKGTLIEVTRVRCNDGRFVFIATDILLKNGSIQNNLKYLERLELLCAFLQNEFVEDLNKFPFRIQVVCPFSDLNLLSTRLSKMPYKVDKILFRNNDYFNGQKGTYCLNLT